jgi:hypothetical protein
VKDHPAWKLFVGGALLIGAFAASCFTILTDESLFAGGSGHIEMSWTVFTQPWHILTGMYSGMTLWAMIGAWLIYLCYILISIARTLKSDRALTSWLYVLCVVDSIGNFLYFHAMPTLYACLLTGLIYFILAYGGKLGFSLMFSALSEVKNVLGKRGGGYAYEDD